MTDVSILLVLSPYLGPSHFISARAHPSANQMLVYICVGRLLGSMKVISKMFKHTEKCMYGWRELISGVHSPLYKATRGCLPLCYGRIYNTNTPDSGLKPSKLAVQTEGTWCQMSTDWSKMVNVKEKYKTLAKTFSVNTCFEIHCPC